MASELRLLNQLPFVDCFGNRRQREEEKKEIEEKGRKGRREWGGSSKFTLREHQKHNKTKKTTANKQDPRDTPTGPRISPETVLTMHVEECLNVILKRLARECRL